MNFLRDNCTLKLFDKAVLSNCNKFECSNSDLNDFFENDSENYYKQLIGKSYCFTLDKNPSTIVCAFTLSNDSIKTHLLPNSRKKAINESIPRQKQLRTYPAVLIGRLGVNKNFKGQGIGSELIDFIKSWFVDPENKTACRFVVVDSYNEEIPIQFYSKNHFDFLFTTEEQEFHYLYPKKDIKEADDLLPLKTRLMKYDLILLNTGE